MNLIQLQPDDVLVLRCPHVLTREQREALDAALRGLLGADQRVMVLDGGQAFDVLRSADAAAKDAPINEARDPHAREVQHVGTDEPEAEGIPPHVWLYRNMLTELQRLAPLGIDETNGQYALAIDQLTDEQRAIPHVSKQLPGDVLTVAVEGKVAEIVRRC